LPEKRKPIATPRGVAVYPRLTTPDTKFNPEGVYSIRFRIPATAAKDLLAKIEAEYDASYVKHLEKARAEAKEKRKPPVKDIKRADKPYKAVVDEEGNETGELEFNFKLPAVGKKQDGTTYTRRPNIVDASGASLLGRDLKIGGGSIVRVSFFLNDFFTPLVGAGVSLRLYGVQVLKLVEFNSASAESMGFGKEDGYTYEADEGSSEFDTSAPAGGQQGLPASDVPDQF
jgi:hypothetical protein